MAPKRAEWGASKPLAALLVATLALLAVVGPTLAAVLLAHDQALSAEQSLVVGDAQEALARLDATINQAASATERVAKEASQDGPCGTATIELMDQLELADDWIQAVGSVKNNSITCSSEGNTLEPVPLGPVNFYGKLHSAVRLNVRFPFAPRETYIVIELHHAAVVINRSLVLAFMSSGHVALGDYSVVAHVMYATRGSVDPSWAYLPGSPAAVTTSESHGRLVAVDRSKKWLSGTIAAVPLTDVDQRTWHAIAILLPLGLLAGVVLAGAVLWLGRMQLALPAVVRAALRRKEFFVEYQPVVDLETGRWCGAEALLRWRRSSGELVRPDLFIPVAEEAGLGRKMTERLLELVAPGATELFVRYPDFRLNLNVTPADLHDPATVDELRTFAAVTGAGSGNLVVEATERDILHFDVTAPIVREIQETGISVVIDDFGTGYSSLAYLEQYGFDGIKIDKTFVDTLGTEAVTSQVVFQIIRMAHELHYSMTAEGVESEEQAEVLRQNGVRYAQGWLFARSMPFEELLAGMVAQHSADSAETVDPGSAARPAQH